jgi:Tfp pilus assembly PilM family ATPase
VGFSLFRSQQSPVLADFGSSGVKLLQVSLGERPQALAAGWIPFTDELRAKPPEARLDHVANELPRILKANGFRGNRVVLAPLSQHILIKHLSLAPADGDQAESVAAAQLAAGLGCDPAALVVRVSKVCEAMRDGAPKLETIALAMSREDVMRYVSLFRRVRLGVVGVHSEIQALVHAFDHLHAADPSARTGTMYADLGYGGTKIAICHQGKLVFAKSVPLSGRAFDARIAEVRRVPIAEVRRTRLEHGVLAAGTHAPDADGDAIALCTGAERVAHEAVEMLADEFCMCLRYHAALFPDWTVGRVVFLGGEARDVGLCQALAAALRLPAKAGDPLSRMLPIGSSPPGLPEPDRAHPDWAVVCGLANAPTDL